MLAEDVGDAVELVLGQVAFDLALREATDLLHRRSLEDLPVHRTAEQGAEHGQGPVRGRAGRLARPGVDLGADEPLQALDVGPGHGRQGHAAEDREDVLVEPQLVVGAGLRLAEHIDVLLHEALGERGDCECLLAWRGLDHAELRPR